MTSIGHQQCKKVDLLRAKIESIIDSPLNLAGRFLTNIAQLVLSHSSALLDAVDDPLFRFCADLDACAEPVNRFRRLRWRDDEREPLEDAEEEREVPESDPDPDPDPPSELESEPESESLRPAPAGDPRPRMFT